MKILNIPFYSSEGDPNRCFEASMKSALGYFMPERDFSLEELDNLVGRKLGLWTYTHQIVPVLHDLGLKVKFYSTDSLDSSTDKDSFLNLIENAYQAKENIEFVLQRTDIDTVVRTAIKCKKYDLFEKRKLEFREIERHLDEGHIPMLLLDRYILEGLSGPYHGHFVVVTGYDESNVYYHENLQVSPMANRKVSKEKFIKAWDNQGTANDLVICYGKTME